MSKESAVNDAIALAKAKLAGLDLTARAQTLSIGAATSAGIIELRAFGQDMALDTKTMRLSRKSDGSTAKPSDTLLILHCLAADTAPSKDSDELASFRDFPGGQFYYQPFLERTTIPLVKRFGNDLESLRRNLARFDSSPLEMGDLGTMIHAFGMLKIALIYRKGDEEFGPEAEVLLSQSVKSVFQAEDAAVLASRICIGLL